MNGLADVLKTFGPARLAAMGVVALALVGFFAFIMMRMNTPDMTVLVSEVSLQDSAQIVRELDRQAIRYELRNEGATILVPRPDVPRLRMRMAELSLPKGGGVGYEIFDRGDSLGTTSFVQNLNHLRALEGEIARSIRTIDRVQAARVHLVIPERQLFQRERQEPTGAVVLRLRGQIEAQQVRAIQHLVAAAVPGMRPNGVSVVDDSGRLLAQGGAGTDQLAASGLEERSQAFERRLQSSVEDILSRVVGPGRARVQVAAELDFNRTTQTQDLFDPESRVVRSTQTREERSQSRDATRGVTVANELPGAAANQGNDQATRDNSERTEEIVNFEISRTQRTEVIEAGRVKRVSVAVLVDGVYTRQGNDLVYAPRGPEEIERITALVRSAIGFDERRGDRVEVVNLRFAEGPRMDELTPQGEQPMFDMRFGREEIVRLIEVGVMLILSLLMLAFVVRPLLKGVLGDGKTAPVAAGGAIAGAGAAAGAQNAIVGPDGTVQPALEGPDGAAPAQPTATIRALEVASVLSEQHQASVGKIGELVRSNPQEATAIVRSWLSEKQPQAA